MRIVVTGGGGFIGSTLSRRLLASGHTVTVFDNMSSGERGERNMEELLRNGARAVRGDIRCSDALAPALVGAEAVVHLAAMASVAVSVADPKACWEINALGTRTVLEAARRAGVRRLVFASTAAVYGMEPRLPSREDDPLAPASPYAEAKIAAEEACHLAHESGDLEAVVLRFFNVYGAGQDPLSSYSGVITRWMEALRQKAAIQVYGDGSQTRDFVHVEDVAGAIELALQAQPAHPGPMNIGSGIATSLLELLQHLGSAYGTKPEVQFQPFRAGDVLHSRADISRAAEHLGFRPTVNLSEGLRSLFQR